MTDQRVSESRLRELIDTYDSIAINGHNTTSQRREALAIRNTAQELLLHRQQGGAGDVRDRDAEFSWIERALRSYRSNLVSYEDNQGGMKLDDMLCQPWEDNTGRASKEISDLADYIAGEAPALSTPTASPDVQAQGEAGEVVTGLRAVEAFLYKEGEYSHQLITTVERAIALLQQREGWQPIETRPKGIHATYLVTNGRQVAPWINGVIHNNTGTVWDWDYGSEITGWQPLPPKPEGRV